MLVGGYHEISVGIFAWMPSNMMSIEKEEYTCVHLCKYRAYITNMDISKGVYVHINMNFHSLVEINVSLYA